MNRHVPLTAGLGGMRTLAGHDKFREPGRWVKFAIKRPIRKQEEEHLGGGAHDASVRNMTAHHSTAGIGDAHVDVRAIARDRSVQSQDFKIAAQVVRLACTGQSQPRATEATDSRDNKACAV